MTRQDNEGKSTEFSLWLRSQSSLDSRRAGFTANNLDYIWTNYKQNRVMVIEEKRFMAKLTYPQKRDFSWLDNKLEGTPNYYGFHLIQFEKRSPEDGNVFLDGSKISVDDLFSFLKFEAPPEVYVSYFVKTSQN